MFEPVRAHPFRIFAPPVRAPFEYFQNSAAQIFEPVRAQPFRIFEPVRASHSQIVEPRRASAGVFQTVSMLLPNLYDLLRMSDKGLLESKYSQTSSEVIS